MSSLELARDLGITDRHARRIKSGNVTTERLAELEGLNAAAGLDALGVENMVQALRIGVQGLETRPKGEQSRILHSLLAEVTLAYDKPIKVVFWLPELPSGPPMAAGSQQSSPKEEPTSGGVSPSGHGFAWRSQMVEATGRWLNSSLMGSGPWTSLC
jgi:hypothetical protein